MPCKKTQLGPDTIMWECSRGPAPKPACQWPLKGKKAGQVCGRVAEVEGLCAAHHRLLQAAEKEQGK